MSLADALAERLPALDRRLRRPELDAIAARLGSPDRVVPEALAWLEEGWAEIAALERALDEVVEAGRAGLARNAVVAWLDARAGGRAGWRERRAAAKRLGVDVIRERSVVDVERVGVREELLLRILDGHLPTDAPVPAIVVRHLVSNRRWCVRLAAATAMGSHARAGGPAGSHVEVVRARADAAGEHPWVRDACDAWLLAAEPEAGLDRLVAALSDRDGSFLVRRLRAERVAAVVPERAPALLARMVDDPSEHVGIGLAALAARLHAYGLARGLLSSGAPKVRLAVAEYVRRALPELATSLVATLLAERLSMESHPATIRALARAASACVERAPETVEILLPALDRVVAADIAGESTEAAAAARRVCRRVSDPAMAALHAGLGRRLPEVPPGETRRWTWAELGVAARPDDDRVGHVLAELAREDFGLWADTSQAGITVRRGDRFSTRAWRVLHEVRHPAPNKRQGHDHTVGRRLTGRLRAPPGRMAEVTATLPPGERTVVDNEGGWMPVLPSVDDVLDLGSGARIYSAFGVTEVRPPPSLARRLANRLALTVRYPALARARTASLQASTTIERQAYVRTLGKELDVEVSFTLDEPVAPRVQTLRAPVRGVAALGALREMVDAVLAPAHTSQLALAVFVSSALGALLVAGHARREAVRTARAALPLVIGGWGTRGKSGTERIKAGLLHGLGHPVFVKTTGCEAMFIAARPGLAAREIFIFRPHDKSSIWEQAAMVQQAAGMGARAMLWECMALRPTYVELLEQEWMRDDLVTLTNAFPDHEDVQGPAGHDIATVISSFVPKRGVALTSEVEFLPVFRERARERGTELEAIDPVEAELFGSDLLALFPYQEHPRNVALVARLAERLGVDRNLAIVTMAEHVVPDLGVLRVYPTVSVAGRRVRFINGMSANERTGCVTNWRRTGCDTILASDPTQAVVVVVNNRADRVARSEVFARILVQDLSADRFVLIGTNLTGLRGYVDHALDVLLVDLALGGDGVGIDESLGRVARWMDRLRVPLPSVEWLEVRARRAFAACGAAWAPTSGWRARVAALLQPEAGLALGLDAVLAQLDADVDLREDLLAGRGGEIPTDDAEVLRVPDAGEVWASWRESLARQVVHARARASLRAGRLDDATFRKVYRELFLATLLPLPDPATSGDQIITRVAETVAPGADVTCMGVQNIKGTGLDFAYRWVSLGTVEPMVRRARDASPEVRLPALRWLDAYDGYGLVDAGLAARRLATAVDGEGPEEHEVRRRVLGAVRDVHDRRVRALSAVARRSWWMPLVAWVERMVDPVAAVHRFVVARRTMRELCRQEVSLSDAATTMQELYTLQKGGWLTKWLLSRAAR